MREHVESVAENKETFCGRERGAGGLRGPCSRRAGREEGEASESMWMFARRRGCLPFDLPPRPFLPSARRRPVPRPFRTACHRLFLSSFKFPLLGLYLLHPPTLEFSLHISSSVSVLMIILRNVACISHGVRSRRPMPTLMACAILDCGHGVECPTCSSHWPILRLSSNTTTFGGLSWAHMSPSGCILPCLPQYRAIAY